MLNKQFQQDIKMGQETNDPILSNMRLVLHLAKKYQYMGLSYEDLVQEGMIGLCRASELFEDGKGKFSTYAATWIKAMMRRALDNKSRTVRVPANQTTNTEVHVKTCELDTKWHGGIEDARVFESEEEMLQDQKIKSLLSKLKPNQAEIIKLKYGIECEEMKTKDIAKKFGVSVQAVNSTLRKSLQLMQS